MSFVVTFDDSNDANGDIDNDKWTLTIITVYLESKKKYIYIYKAKKRKRTKKRGKNRKKKQIKTSLLRVYSLETKSRRKRLLINRWPKRQQIFFTFFTAWRTTNWRSNHWTLKHRIGTVYRLARFGISFSTMIFTSHCR